MDMTQAGPLLANELRKDQLHFEKLRMMREANNIKLSEMKAKAAQTVPNLEVPPPSAPPVPSVAVPEASRSMPVPLTDAQVAAKESSNNPLAKNPKSSATGLYQMTDAARADALKINPALADMDYSDPAVQGMYRDAYKKSLTGQMGAFGIDTESINDNDINKAWVVGAKGYSKIREANPNTPLENILSKEAIANNPNLQGKTAGQFLADPDPYSRVKTGSGVPPINMTPQQIESFVAEKKPTGREVLIAKQDLANSTDRATRERAQAVIDKANSIGIDDQAVAPEVPKLSIINSTVNRQAQPVPSGIMEPELGNEFGDVLPGETKDVVPPMDTTRDGGGLVAAADPEAQVFDVQETTNVAPEVPPVAATEEKVDSVPKPEVKPEDLPETQKETYNELGKRGSQTDAASIQAEIANYAKERDLKGKSGASPRMPEKKEDLSPSFWDKLSKSFGDLFTDKEFIRFGILLAGGLLTGGSFGGSLKYAGLYALQSADKREAAQASENKELKKKLIDQGYSMEAIDKYFGSGRTEDLGEPKTTLTYKTTGEQMTIDRGPDSGKVYQVREATYATGKRKGDVEKVVMVDGKPIPLDTFQRTYQSRGLNVVPYTASEHSPAAVSKRFDTLLIRAGDIAEETLENKLGSSDYRGKPNPSRIGLPGGKTIANQSASYFKAIGFNPDNADDAREINTLMVSAVNDMIADKNNRNLKEVRSIEPYLAANIIKFRTGLNPDMLRINETTMVPPEKIVALHDLGKQVSFQLNNGKISEPQVQKLLQQIAAKYNTDPELGKKYKASKDETKFYQYAKDFLSDMLKQAETK